MCAQIFSPHKQIIREICQAGSLQACILELHHVITKNNATMEVLTLNTNMLARVGVEGGNLLSHVMNMAAILNGAI